VQQFKFNKRNETLRSRENATRTDKARLKLRAIYTRINKEPIKRQANIINILRETNPASQFAYLYYTLKVCNLFVKKKYILLSVLQKSRQALGHTITTSLTELNSCHLSACILSP